MIRNTFVVIVICAMVAESHETFIRNRRNSDTCGVPKIKTGYIVQGEDFKRGSFPWVVALTHLETTPPKFFCAGTLISKTFVISAAHCILPKDAQKKTLAREILAYFGAHNLSNPYEPGRYSFSPRRIFIHDEWSHLTIEYDADVSLLEFGRGSIQFNTFVQPICLLDSKYEPTVTYGMVTGWGKSEDSTKNHENIPKLLTVLVQTNDKCLPKNGKLADLSSERTFCAGGLRNGSGICTGDSGGGLFFKVSEVYHLKGIVSSSLMKDDNCDISKNTIYTNVPEYGDWIQGIKASLQAPNASSQLVATFTVPSYGRNAEGKIVVCCPRAVASRCIIRTRLILGSCIPLEDCKHLFEVFNKKPLSTTTKKFLQDSSCGFVGGKPLVCCSDIPNDSVPEIEAPEIKPTTTTTTTEAPEQQNEDIQRLLLMIEEKKNILPEAPECGSQVENRIFGGEVAEITDFNWIVLLKYSKPRDPPGFHCGGSLINRRYVLTAALCLQPKDTSWNLIEVRVGEHTLSTDMDCHPEDEDLCLPSVQDIGIMNKLAHPRYRKENKDSLYDIGLLRMKMKVRFNEFIKPICLPLAKHLWNRDYSGKYFTAAGWGKTENNTAINTKLSVRLPFVDHDTCRAAYSGLTTLVDQQICAGGELGKDTCRGDAGGPLMIKDLTHDLGPYYIAGIVSYGTECGARNIPGVYTKVADYLKWIVDTIY